MERFGPNDTNFSSNKCLLHSLESIQKRERTRNQLLTYSCRHASTFFCSAPKIGHEIYFFTCCGRVPSLPLAFDISLECLVQQIKTNSCDTFFYGSQYILRSRKMRARSKSFGSLALGRAAKKSEQYRKNKNLHSLKVDFSIYLVSTFNPSSSFCLALLCCRFYESFNRRTSRSS